MNNCKIFPKQEVNEYHGKTGNHQILFIFAYSYLADLHIKIKLSFTFPRFFPNEVATVNQLKAGAQIDSSTVLLVDLS